MTLEEQYQEWLADPDAQLEYQLWAKTEDLKLLESENHDSRRHWNIIQARTLGHAPSSVLSNR
jgi:hypothetical protein